LIGALSDVWGRRMFLLLTVVCTCAPIPLMTISPWWFFALLSISGTFAVTFSIVFAYVADITNEEERSSAYGLVSATFAASLVTSPVIGTYITKLYGRNVVVALSSSIALLDVVFILIAVPESLPEKIRPTGWAHPISWDRVDPFSSLRTALSDSTNMMLCLCVFLSYLPEAGQYSCFFIYLTKVVGFSVEKVASFIAVIGVLSIIAQTALLTTLIQTTSKSTTIMVALIFQTVQLFFYAFSRSEYMMWVAGALAAVSSISYPAFSTLISTNAEADQQGLVQGMVTGVRGLCNGLGPAVFGVIFYLFNVKVDGDLDLDGQDEETSNIVDPDAGDMPFIPADILPGPPFLFGACSVILALTIAAFLPQRLKKTKRRGGVELEAESGEPIETNKLLQKSSTS
jgi:predicted MFS family arabinose efflux permease